MDLRQCVHIFCNYCKEFEELYKVNKPDIYFSTENLPLFD